MSEDRISPYDLFVEVYVNPIGTVELALKGSDSAAALEAQNFQAYGRYYLPAQEVYPRTKRVPHDHYRKVTPKVSNPHDDRFALWVNGDGEGIWLDDTIEAHSAAPSVASQAVTPFPPAARTKAGEVIVPDWETGGTVDDD